MESLWTPLFSIMVFTLVFGVIGGLVSSKNKSNHLSCNSGMYNLSDRIFNRNNSNEFTSRHGLNNHDE